MSPERRNLLIGLGGGALLVCCLVAFLAAASRRQQGALPSGGAAPDAPPAPTATPLVVVVTATPALTVVVPTLPADPAPVTDLDAFVAYAEAIKPIVDAGLEAAERDGAIVEAAEDDENAVCGSGLTAHPTLSADAALMDDLVRQLDAISPPAEAAAAVHTPLRESVRLWGDALDSINQSCQTENQLERGLLRGGAVLQYWASALNFRQATENFWLLLIANGLEELAN